jgi:hypothetical protein
MTVLQDKKLMKIYIAGPMRGKPDSNKKSFYNAARRFESTGLYEVYNPAFWDDKQGIKEEDLEDVNVLREIVSTDIHMLLCCEAIYMLRGWEHSVGARAEHSLAQFMKLHIQYE